MLAFEEEGPRKSRRKTFGARMTPGPEFEPATGGSEMSALTSALLLLSALEIVTLKRIFNLLSSQTRTHKQTKLKQFQEQ